VAVSEASMGLTRACNELGKPITGGMSAFNNETLGARLSRGIGVLGILEDASRVLKIGFRERGTSLSYLNGSTR